MNPVVNHSLWSTIREEIMGDYHWAGEGPSAIHLVHRRDVREDGNRMAQSLCKVACVAYGAGNLASLPTTKKLCGNCRNHLERLTPTGGSFRRMPTSLGAGADEGMEQEPGVGYGSENQAEHEQPDAVPAPQHYP